MAREKRRVTGAKNTSLKPIILERFGGARKCSGHCDGPADFRVLSENGELVAATVCAKGYVSRVMAYGLGDTRSALSSLINGALGPEGDFSDEDVRTATRYAWDMGVEDRARDIMFRVAYWTQNYRRTKSEVPDRKALFACTQCNALFIQPVYSPKTVCSACSRLGKL